MEEVGKLLRQKAVQPISPINSFDISQLEQALLFFSKGTHVGKIVVTYEDPEKVIKVQSFWCHQQAPLICSR